jgi:hypothetical protein
LNQTEATGNRDIQGKSPPSMLAVGFRRNQIGATGFEPRVALYLLPYPASV